MGTCMYAGWAYAIFCYNFQVFISLSFRNLVQILHIFFAVERAICCCCLLFFPIRNIFLKPANAFLSTCLFLSLFSRATQNRYVCIHNVHVSAVGSIFNSHSTPYDRIVCIASHSFITSVHTPCMLCAYMWTWSVQEREERLLRNVYGRVIAASSDSPTWECNINTAMRTRIQRKKTMNKKTFMHVARCVAGLFIFRCFFLVLLLLFILHYGFFSNSVVQWIACMSWRKSLYTQTKN